MQASETTKQFTEEIMQLHEGTNVMPHTHVLKL